MYVCMYVCMYVMTTDKLYFRQTCTTTEGLDDGGSSYDSYDDNKHPASRAFYKVLTTMKVCACACMHVCLYVCMDAESNT